MQVLVYTTDNLLEVIKRFQLPDASAYRVATTAGDDITAAHLGDQNTVSIPGSKFTVNDTYYDGKRNVLNVVVESRK